MKIASIDQEFASLPPEAQREILDFVAFLKTRYPTQQAIKKAERTRLADEPFVGMWRNRAEMQDSTAWVRDVRCQEWEQG